MTTLMLKIGPGKKSEEKLQNKYFLSEEKQLNQVNNKLFYWLM